MFLALSIPEWIDHPVTRHVLGRRGEGRWAAGVGLRPQVVLAAGVVALLVAARVVALPPGTYVAATSPLLLGVLLAPIVAAFATGCWQGTRGLAGLRRDPRWRDLMASGVRRGEVFDALAVGLALRALVLPTFLFQALVVLAAADDVLLQPARGGGGLDLGAVLFRWLVLAALFAVAAGPVLDYALLVGLAQAASGRGGAAALAAGAGHLLLAGAALAVGFGVFGVVFLVVRAEALRAACRARVEAFTTETDDAPPA